MFKNIAVILTLILLIGCSQEQPAEQKAQATPAPTPPQSQTHQAQNSPKEAGNLLVFFLDPNGGPCQMQGKILNQMSSELEGKVLIRPVKTTVPVDRDIFYAYGIRALPTILLADSAGKEIKRLPPGVHAAETILDLLNQIPAE